MFGMINRLVLFLRVEFGISELCSFWLSVVLLCILLFIFRFGVCLCRIVSVLCILIVEGVLDELKFECDISVILGLILKWYSFLVVMMVIFVSFFVVGLMLICVLVRNIW